MNKAQVYSHYKDAKVSPKKVGPVLKLVRGKSAKEAERILKFDSTKAAKLTLKVLQSALANAKDAFNLKEEDLVVSDLRVSKGLVLSRPNFSGRGRYSRLLKRSSHITVGLSEVAKKEVKTSEGKKK